MQWPLRNQILFPMVAVTLVGLVGLSVLNAYLSVRRAQRRINSELALVSDTLAMSNFPLTDRVLKQMRGFAGAEFVLVDQQGEMVSSSTPHGDLLDLPSIAPTADVELSGLSEAMTIEDRQYFHTAFAIRRPDDSGGPRTLHVLYPVDRYWQTWRDVAYPPLFVGSAMIVLALGCSIAIASRATRPLERLRNQVNEIAEGQFRSVVVPSRDDEIADLSRAVNRMAEMLAQYDTRIRRNERLRTLGQLGGGIAHQIRNSVTGCRMAIELHTRDCPLQCESLDIALRQIALIENYVQRFLSLGRSDTEPHALVDLGVTVKNVTALVSPTARHLDVQLTSSQPDRSVEVLGDPEALDQLLVNLVLNSIEAASEVRGESDDVTATVAVSLQCVEGWAILIVEDTGPGPEASIASSLFEPFVTDKPDGTGLGLAVVQETAAAHGGTVVWQRRDTRTRFTVRLPLVPHEATKSQESIPCRD